MSRENIGVAIGATGLAALAASFAAVMSGALDELVAMAAPIAGLLIVGVLVIAIAPSGGNSVAAHSHGNRSRSRVVRHEKAHQRALRRAGAGGSSRKIWRNSDGTWSGRVRSSKRRFNRLPRASRAAVYLAGGRAAPGTNCNHDNAAAAQILAGAPARERDEAHRLADRWAR